MKKKKKKLGGGGGACCICHSFSIDVPNIWTPGKLCNHPKIRTRWLLPHRVMGPKDVHRMANSVDPDQSDLGLHCLPRTVCLKTKGHYGT